MSNVRTARRYTDEAVKVGDTMSRENYKKIKHMDKIEMANYIRQIWLAGYKEGMKAAEKKTADVPAVKAEE